MTLDRLPDPLLGERLFYFLFFQCQRKNNNKGIAVHALFRSSKHGTRSVRALTKRF